MRNNKHTAKIRRKKLKSDKLTNKQYSKKRRVNKISKASRKRNRN